MEIEHTTRRPQVVGDVIERDQVIPGNVRTVRDGVQDLWALDPRGGWILTEYRGESVPQGERDRSDPVSDWNLLMMWAPLHVVEVDPEPQPAGSPREVERGLSDYALHEAVRIAQANTLDEIRRIVGAEQGADLVEAVRAIVGDRTKLRLPEVPEGTVALVTQDDDGSPVRFVRGRTSGIWLREGWSDSLEWSLLDILRVFDGVVTVEFAPPREPRTWGRIIDDTPADELPDIVRVARASGPEIWALDRNGVYFRKGDGVGLTLVELRTLGEVAEVLGSDGT